MNGALSSLQADRAEAAAPMASAERGERLERLTDALSQLPDQERLAIHLFYLEPDPVVAAQDALGLSRSGFYKLLARARGRLGELLGSVAP